MNLIEEKETLYYKTDIFETRLFDQEEGKQEFDFLRKLEDKNIGINFNMGEVSVDSLINQICITSDYQQNIKLEENGRGDMSNNIISVLGTLLGAFLGAFVTYFFNIRQQKIANEERKSFNASILYYDLKSIEDYLEKERASVNLRYLEKWQNVVAECSFLEESQIRYVYKIYDLVYNYNYSYKNKEKDGLSIRKEDILQYGMLKKLMYENWMDGDKYSKDYEELLNILLIWMQRANNKYA